MVQFWRSVASLMTLLGDKRVISLPFFDSFYTFMKNLDAFDRFFHLLHLPSEASCTKGSRSLRGTWHAAASAGPLDRSGSNKTLTPRWGWNILVTDLIGAFAEICTPGKEKLSTFFTLAYYPPWNTGYFSMEGTPYIYSLMNPNGDEY